MPCQCVKLLNQQKTQLHYIIEQINFSNAKKKKKKPGNKKARNQKIYSALLLLPFPVNDLFYIDQILTPL